VVLNTKAVQARTDARRCAANRLRVEASGNDILDAHGANPLSAMLSLIADGERYRQRGRRAGTKGWLKQCEQSPRERRLCGKTGQAKC
jgi:hypothetical protein